MDNKTNYLWQKDGFIIRHLKREDFKKYFEENYCPLDSEVSYLTGSKENFTEDEVISYLDKCLNSKDCYYFLIISKDEKIFGEFVINEIDFDLEKAHFRIAIFSKNLRGLGIGTWAIKVALEFVFEKLKFHRLELSVFSFNEKAIKIYSKLGFKKEGVLRDAVKNKGKYADEILMAILKNEWIEMKK